MGEYVFKESDEAERLRVQARVWEPSAERLLDQIGVPVGGRCVDLGCGAMGILGPLARRVGPAGEVVGVELIGPQLAAARAYAAEEGLGRVEVIEADAFDTRLPRGYFDLVHARFLLAPLGRTGELLGEMLSLVKPGGVVVLEEPDQTSWEYFPKGRVWARVKDTFERVFPRFGGDANAGQRLFGVMRGLGLDDVRVSAAIVALQGGHPYLRTPIAGLTSMRRHILEGGIMTEQELDEALVEMERLSADPGAYATSFTLTQVWGRRPRAS